jgi:hypothetical protein
LFALEVVAFDAGDVDLIVGKLRAALADVDGASHAGDAGRGFVALALADLLDFLIHKHIHLIVNLLIQME